MASTVSACPLPETFPLGFGEFSRRFRRPESLDEYVRGFCTRRTQGKVITLVDDERSETYATLDEAIKAAQTWYIGLTGGKLPSWNYSIQTLPDFRRAVGLYKSQIALAAG